MSTRNQFPQSWLFLFSFLLVCFYGKAIAADLVGFSCNHAPEGTIFCDDFESGNLDGRYFEKSSKLSVDDVGRDGSKGIRVSFDKGVIEAGSLKKSFGTTPSGYIGNPALNSDIKYDEIYWRIDLRTQPGWQGGGGDKLSRVTTFAKDNWAQGMIGHIWSSGDYLVMDPASGIDADGNLVSTKYNDFDKLRWLGSKRGNIDLFSTENSGQWYCIEAHVKLNTPGNSDGLFEFWIDDTLQANTSNLNWHGDWNSNSDNLKLNAVMIENHWNKGSPVDQERYMDNFVISTSRIGCDTGDTNIADTTAPVITLIGEPSIEVNQNTPYTDEGATATDNKDDNDKITLKITVDSNVNTAMLGGYRVKYNVSDLAGNAATEVVRTVNVVAEIPPVDTEAPIITLLGESTEEVIKGSIYTDPGAMATDNLDKAVRISSTGEVNTAVTGTYIITYSATDRTGNTSTKTRTVKVIEETPPPVTPDTTKPVITLSGEAVISLSVGETFIDPGYAAVDDRDGNIKVTVNGTIGTSKAGAYTLTYSATDVAGNTAVTTRTVTVVTANSVPVLDESSNHSGGGGVLGGWMLGLLMIFLIANSMFNRQQFFTNSFKKIKI